ncbi:MAG: hypothetical protein Q4C03_06435, partial [bacterium]|nr:hypothetical protein [bacterium]
MKAFALSFVRSTFLLGMCFATVPLMSAQLTEYSFDAYDSLDEARIEAIKTKRNLFVLSGAPWCTYCNQTKAHLTSLGDDFKNKFVVYYADVSKNAEMSGRLPQYGTFDPRTIDASNGWTASMNAYADSAGYSPEMINACIAKANLHTVGAISSLTLDGLAAVFPGKQVTLDAKLGFDDGKVMFFPADRMTWEVTGANATLSQGVLSVSENATVGATLKVTAIFPSGIETANGENRVTLDLKVVSYDDVKAIDIDKTEINLADSTDVRLLCLADFGDEKRGEIAADSWSVEVVEMMDVPAGAPISKTSEPSITISNGNLIYSDFAVSDHKIKVTATFGSLKTEKILTVWGASRAWPSQLTLDTTDSVLAPGEVVRLKCKEVSYTYKGEIKTTDNTELFDFIVIANASTATSQYNIVGEGGLVQRFGKIFIHIDKDLRLAQDHSVSMKIYCRYKGSAYTTYECDESLNTAVLGGKFTIAKTFTPTTEEAALVEAGQTKYKDINHIWLEKYFADKDWSQPGFLELDSDGDGYSNGAEFVLGTDPTNAASKFKYTAIHFDAHEVIYWLMWDELPGREWTFQGKESELGDAWVEIDRKTIDIEEARKYHVFRVEANGAVHTPRQLDFETWIAPKG